MGCNGHGSARLILRILLFIVVFFFFVDASRSQMIDGVEIVTPRIITGEWDSITKKFPVAVEFTIAKGWHLYWLNPGDAGSPPEVKWTLPKGWSIDKLQFPVPQHVVEDGFESYAYYDTLTLYTEITSPSAPKPDNLLDATIKWMVCKDICVAGKLAKKWKIAATRQDHAWPKLPLIPTLEEAGYEWSVSPDAALNSSGELIQFVEVQDNNGVLVTPKALFAYFTEGIVAKIKVGSGVIRVITRGGSSFSIDRDLNGLVFIDDKVYWLKAR